jgi:dihydrofolate reductase
MTIVSLIAAIDENRGLGKANNLLCHLPADLKHFKELTLGKPVIMGRKTYQSIGKALPGRLNIVLSRHHVIIEDATVVGSLDQALVLTKNVPEVMIIGGAHVFNQALPLAHQIYLTVIHMKFEADVFFPELNQHVWTCLEKLTRHQDEKNKYDMTFYRYERSSQNNSK